MVRWMTAVLLLAVLPWAAFGQSCFVSMELSNFRADDDDDHILNHGSAEGFRGKCDGSTTGRRGGDLASSTAVTPARPCSCANIDDDADIRETLKWNAPVEPAGGWCDFSTYGFALDTAEDDDDDYTLYTGHPVYSDDTGHISSGHPHNWLDDDDDTGFGHGATIDGAGCTLDARNYDMSKESRVRKYASIGTNALMSFTRAKQLTIKNTTFAWGECIGHHFGIGQSHSRDGQGQSKTCSGGALTFHWAATVKACSFYSNFAKIQGGGIFFMQRAGTVTQSFFHGNGCADNDVWDDEASYSGGGGVHFGASGTVTDCVFQYNHADAAGAVYIAHWYGDNTKLSLIARTSFVSNSARMFGGAINDDGFSPRQKQTGGATGAFPLRIEDCVFKHNHAGGASAIMMWGEVGVLDLAGRNIFENNTLNAYGGYKSGRDWTFTWPASCPSGRYATLAGISNQTMATWDLAIDTCPYACPAGRYSLQNSHADSEVQCADCPLGRYDERADAGVTECRACTPGKFNTATGATSIDSCQTCVAGVYCNAGTQGSCTDVASYCKAGSAAPTPVRDGFYAIPYGTASCWTAAGAAHVSGTVTVVAGAVATSAELSTIKTAMGASSTAEVETTGRTNAWMVACGGLLAKEDETACEAGYTCKLGVKTPCVANTSFCPANVAASTGVRLGYYATPVGAATLKTGESLSEAGYLAAAGVRHACADVTSYCPGGTAATVGTRAGFYTTPLGGPRFTGETSCEAGYRCSGGQRLDCTSAATFCSGGKPAAVAVTSGYYSVPEAPGSRRTGEQQCVLGATFCVAGLRTNCTTCDAGDYITSACSVTANQLCTACPAGKYSDAQDSVQCTACPPGYRQHQEGKASCIACTDAASFCQSGAITATPASAGFVTTPEGVGLRRTAQEQAVVGTDYADAGVRQSCSTCAAGKKATTQCTTTADISCADCAAGKFSDSVDAASCTVCPAGWQQHEGGKEDCIACTSAAFFCPSGAIVPTSASAGFVTTPEGAGLRRTAQEQAVVGTDFADAGVRQSCSTCAAGKKMTTDCTTTADRGCVDCAAGKFSTLANSAACTACPSGWSQSTAGSASCTACTDSGKYCTAGAITPVAATPGFVTVPETGGARRTGETQATLGTDYAAAGLRLSCATCVAGRFASSPCTRTSDQSCFDCAAGKYSTAANQVSCDFCPVGWSQASAGASACVHCNATNSFCGARGIAIPTPVTSGYYTTPETAGAARTGQTACVLGETFCAGGVRESCRQCPPGRSEVVPCTLTGNRVCVDCAKGSVSDTANQASCDKCETGQSTAGLAAQSSCTVCTQGKVAPFRAEAACTACAVGFYMPTTGGTLCTACPRGYFADATEASTCSQCPLGRATDLQSSKTCAVCNAGQYADAMGQSLCTACRPGQYSDKPAALACAACAPGTWQGEPNKVECVPCLDGTLGLETGATTIAACLQCDEESVECDGVALKIVAGHWRDPRLWNTTTGQPIPECHPQFLPASGKRYDEATGLPDPACLTHDPYFQAQKCLLDSGAACLGTGGVAKSAAAANATTTTTTAAAAAAAAQRRRRLSNGSSSSGLGLVGVDVAALSGGCAGGNESTDMSFPLCAVCNRPQYSRDKATQLCIECDDGNTRADQPVAAQAVVVVVFILLFGLSIFLIVFIGRDAKGASVEDEIDDKPEEEDDEEEDEEEDEEDDEEGEEDKDVTEVDMSKGLAAGAAGYAKARAEAKYEEAKQRTVDALQTKAARAAGVDDILEMDGAAPNASSFTASAAKAAAKDLVKEEIAAAKAAAMEAIKQKIAKQKAKMERELKRQAAEALKELQGGDVGSTDQKLQQFSVADIQAVIAGDDGDATASAGALVNARARLDEERRAVSDMVKAMEDEAGDTQAQLAAALGKLVPKVNIDNLSEWDETITNLKLIVSFFQVTSLMGLSYEIEWPPVFSQMQAFLRWPSNALDASILVQPFMALFRYLSSQFTALQCQHAAASFPTQFFLHVSILPIAVLLSLAALCIAQALHRTAPRCRRRFTQRQALDRCVKLLNTIVFLLYPGLGLRVVRTFKCRDVNGIRWLEADMSIKCGEGFHTTLVAVAVAVILLVILGIPFAMAVLLTRARRDVLRDADGNVRMKPYVHDGYEEERPQSQLDTKEFKMRYGPMYKSYDQDYVWFEALELLRKFILTGGLVLLPSGSTTQLFLATLVCFFYLCYALNVQPLKDPPNAASFVTPDRMLQMTNIQIFLTMLMGIMLQTQKPPPGSDQAIIMDALLTISQLIVMILGLGGVIAAALKFQRTAKKKAKAVANAASKAAQVASRILVNQRTLALWHVARRRMGFGGGKTDDVRIAADVVLAAFRSFAKTDADKNRGISVDELPALFKELKIKDKDQDGYARMSAKYLKRHDKNKNALLEEAEFLELFAALTAKVGKRKTKKKKKNAVVPLVVVQGRRNKEEKKEEGEKVTVVESFTGPRTNTVALKRAVTGVDGLAEQALRDAFAETDANGNGSIDVDELKGLLRRTPCAPPDVDARELMRKYGRDGVMGYEEFRGVYEELQGYAERALRGEV